MAGPGCQPGLLDRTSWTLRRRPMPTRRTCAAESACGGRVPRANIPSGCQALKKWASRSPSSLQFHCLFAASRTQCPRRPGTRRTPQLALFWENSPRLASLPLLRLSLSLSLQPRVRNSQFNTHSNYRCFKGLFRIFTQRLFATDRPTVRWSLCWENEKKDTDVVLRKLTVWSTQTRGDDLGHGTGGRVP